MTVYTYGWSDITSDITSDHISTTRAASARREAEARALWRAIDALIERRIDSADADERLALSVEIVKAIRHAQNVEAGRECECRQSYDGQEVFEITCEVCKDAPGEEMPY